MMDQFMDEILKRAKETQDENVTLTVSEFMLLLVTDRMARDKGPIKVSELRIAGKEIILIDG